VVSVLVIVLFSPGWKTRLVIVEPGRVFVANWVYVTLPPGVVNVAPGSVFVSNLVTVVSAPGAVVVNVGPRRVMKEV
jgi:hypothetical protein